MAKETYEELLERIQTLEKINDQLLKDQMQDVKLNYAWAGSLGHWYFDYQANKVTYNPLKVLALGYTKEEIKEEVNYQFFTDRLHPDDYQMVMNNMIDHLKGLTPAYEVEYRIKAKNGSYKWYYDRGIVTQRDREGNPLFLSGIVFDISEKKKYQEELEEKNRMLREQSSRDSLTYLYNHRSLYEKLNEYILHARKYQPLVIAMMDIDDFKLVNDLKGHVFGDSILLELSKIMLHHARKDDFVARYGGEEFFMIFPSSTMDEVYLVCEQIRKDFMKFTSLRGQKITVSIGLAVYEKGTASEFIHQADLKLYESKHNGKNQISY
ncbi:MAG: sensor domain-containing diguanylate cyclase [Bacillota bacterium]|nr:MAG: sensor domain-containing diguanylate cyclase [Bacillota bacterium]